MPTTTHHITTLPLQNSPWLLIILAVLIALGLVVFFALMRHHDHLYDLEWKPQLPPGYCEKHFSSHLRIIGSHTAETRLYDQDDINA